MNPGRPLEKSPSEPAVPSWLVGTDAAAIITEGVEMTFCDGERTE
jgi:hypothetical protein